MGIFVGQKYRHKETEVVYVVRKTAKRDVYLRRDYDQVDIAPIDWDVFLDYYEKV